MVVVENAFAGDDDVDAVGAIDGDDVVDDDIGTDDAVGAQEMQDRGHSVDVIMQTYPRLMRAMGWMFISGLSS